MDNLLTQFMPTAKVSKLLLTINIFIALVYFSWWLQPSHIANPFFYFLLFFGEIYHVFMAIAFWLTIWPGKEKRSHTSKDFRPTIDVFIPVAGEPLEIIRDTILAAKKMEGYTKNIYILNDGYVAKKDNWQKIESLAQELKVICITRQIGYGAKAGNINNALYQTKGDIVVIFDADMRAFPEFLKRVIPYFNDPSLGFVQTPQYYVNASENLVSQSSWEQQNFFYGTIMKGKSYRNAAFICGTNVAIRREALQEVGGMYEKSIAEDFLTSLFVHGKNWNSRYLTEVLSSGLAPQDLGSYYKQQLRWARGSLEVLFWENPIFNKHLTFSQKLQYISSSAYYFNGFIVLIDSIMPLVFLFTGVQIVAAATTTFAIYFIPFMIATLYTIYLASEGSLTFRAMSFSQSSFALQLQAIFSTLIRKKVGFAVTSKKKIEGNYLSLVIPHILYILLAVVGVIVGLHREGINPSVVTNIAWAVFNSILFIPFIQAAFAGVHLSNPFIKVVRVNNAA